LIFAAVWNKIFKRPRKTEIYLLFAALGAWRMGITYEIIILTFY
jgi:hypothetical protein